MEKNIKVNHLGPILCYSFGNQKMNRCNISCSENIRDNDSIVFCFGEIDCRCHIRKHITSENSYQQL